jgi:ligand-binding SRPBCC domain-containing protein
VTVRFDLETLIAAPVQAVFDASLDIDAHLASMESSGEEAIGGVTSGSIGLGETVTWRAKHFGITWKMTSKITELDAPHSFLDEQVKGPFKLFRHQHRFEPTEAGTRMTDHIVFDAPLGVLGLIAERVVLGTYLPKLIGAISANHSRTAVWVCVETRSVLVNTNWSAELI